LQRIIESIEVIMSDTLAAYFTNVVKNADLYSPLTQEGNICGVGVRLALNHDPPLYDNTPCAGTAYRYITIVHSIDSNTPAQKAGLQPNDIILEVDGINLYDGQQLYLPDDVAAMIRGLEGSEVVIMVERGGSRMKFVLKREPLDESPKPSWPSSPLTSAILRKAMPVTPEALSSLELFER
jgi:C-terminal processing protease CtpA/Prc